jgi:hypothetical protein
MGAILGLHGSTMFSVLTVGSQASLIMNKVMPILPSNNVA